MEKSYAMDTIRHYTEQVKDAFVDAGRAISEKPSKLLAVLGVAGTLAFGSCDVNGSDPGKDPVYNTAPEIELLGDNPYNTVVGDPFFEQGYSATDLEDGDLTGYVQTSSNDNQNEPGTYAKSYSVEDEGGKTASAQRTINRTVETSELESLLNTPTIMSDGNGGNLTVKEAAESLGFNLYRGTNDNVEDNIEGSYLASGSGTDNLGTPYSYSDVSEEFSNQNGFSIDRENLDGNFDNIPLTGFDEDKLGIIHGWDYTDDNPGDDRVVLSNMEQLPNGDLSVDRLDLSLFDDVAGKEWLRFSETFVKQDP